MSDRVDLAVAIVYPLMKDYFKNWDPLKVCVSLIYLQFLFDGLSFISTFPCFFLSTLERKKKKKETEPLPLTWQEKRRLQRMLPVFMSE